MHFYILLIFHTPHIPRSAIRILSFPPNRKQCVATAHWRGAINLWLTACCWHNAIGQERRCARGCDKKAWSLSDEKYPNVMFAEIAKLRCCGYWSGGLSSTVQRFGVLNTTKVTQIYQWKRFVTWLRAIRLEMSTLTNCLTGGEFTVFYQVCW